MLLAILLLLSLSVEANSDSYLFEDACAEMELANSIEEQNAVLIKYEEHFSDNQIYDCTGDQQ